MLHENYYHLGHLAAVGLGGPEDEVAENVQDDHGGQLEGGQGGSLEWKKQIIKQFISSV